MKNNERFVIIMALVILCSLIINTIQLQKASLDEVIFFEHHYDIDSVRGGHNIMIYYITNKNDDRTVNFLDFGEVKLKTIFTDEERFHFNKVVTLNMSFTNKLSGKENMILDNPTVHFNNGETEKYDIGKIYLSPVPENEIAKVVTTSSYSDGSSNTLFYLEEPGNIVGVQSGMYDYLEEKLSLSITFDGHEKYNPITVSHTKELENYIKLDEIKLPIRVEENLLINCKYDDLQSLKILEPILRFEIISDSGKTHFIKIHNIGVYQNMTNKLVRQVIESRGQ